MLGREAARGAASDRKILTVGAMQALFEGVMYIFVLQWPPALKAALGPNVPFGKVFSCFMVCIMVGSALFSILNQRGGLAIHLLFIL